MPRLIDISGQIFGRLVVLSRAENAGKDVRWHCRCSCGREVIVRSHGLRTGNTRSCGCLHKEQLARRNALGDFQRPIKHGMSETRTFKIWAGMLKRCQNKHSKAYRDYGARGITVCSRWCDFRNFLQDMGQAPDGCSIDRIDVNGNYEPGNCRWATQAEQARNRRNNRLLTLDGETQCLADWALARNISISTLHYRLSNGWTLRQALTLPVEHGRPLSGRAGA